MLKKRPFEFPGEKAIRVICDTDAYNECDDQFCVAHLWMTPRFDVKAMIAAQYGHVMNVQGTEQKSYDELVNLATLMDIRDEVNILHGGVTALPDENTPVDSEGARFIIEEAMKDDPRRSRMFPGSDDRNCICLPDGAAYCGQADSGLDWWRCLSGR